MNFIPEKRHFDIVQIKIQKAAIQFYFVECVFLTDK